MGRIRRNMYFALRLFSAFLLLLCISPAPETPPAGTTDVASQLSAISGRLKLVIWKSNYTVTLYKGDRPVKTYRAVFGKGYQDGDKQRMGDKRTPEGDFYICTMNHSRRFYKFMGLSYPGLKHADQGVQSGVISPVEYSLIKKAIEAELPPPWETRLGGAVGLHGRIFDAGNAAQQLIGANWTDGCIALDNADIDEIYNVVSLGTPVTILP